MSQSLSGGHDYLLCDDFKIQDSKNSLIKVKN